VALPEPKPGFVVRYDYFWTVEAAAGRDQGKDRPASYPATIRLTDCPSLALQLRNAIKPGSWWNAIVNLTKLFFLDREVGLKRW